jgi:hypothetical protein
MRTNRRLAIAVTAAACSGRPPVPLVEPTPRPNVPAEAVLKIVHADTPFTVELASELSSVTDRPGEPFRASVVTPLEADDGDTLVSPDAEISGQIIAVIDAPDPAILVRFDSIETRWGPRVLRATFARAQPQASVVGERARFAGYDGAIRQAPGIPISTSDAPTAPAPIDLPAGARVRLVLTDPLAVRAPEPLPNPPSP